jgi:hypothetical protein
LTINMKNMDFSLLDERIAHLQEEQIHELMVRYYAGEKVSDLLLEYKIMIKPSHLYTLFPPVISDKDCLYCEEHMVIPWESKTRRTLLDEEFCYCPSCRHESSNRCTCRHCTDEREKAFQAERERQKQQEELKTAFLEDYLHESNWTKVLENNLTMEDRLYLAAVLRSSLSENTMYIEPLVDKENPIAPTQDFEVELIRTLTGRNILVPHGISAFEEMDVHFTDDEKPKVSYKIYLVHYRLNIDPADGEYDAMIKRLLYPDFRSEESFHEFCYNAWKKVSFFESLEYLLYQMDKVGYSFNPGDKTYRVIEYLLEHFSVSQIYGIIYKAVANSTQRLQAREITKIHAQNSVITSCENYGQRAIAQGWKLSHYYRIKELPESYLSSVLFTTIMQIAELGFTETPTPHF